MKVCVFYPKSIFSAWSVSEGIVDTLKRMGHDVLNCGFDPQSKQLAKSQYPKHEELESCDLILVSGPEHIGKFIHALYPGWKQLKTKRVAWMHETVERADYGKLPIEGIKPDYDVLYTPAAQDEKHGLTWLPFGVDTEMFSPREHDPRTDEPFYPRRDIDVAFIGLVYGPRQKFLEELKPHLGGINLTIGNCQVQDLSGINIRKSVELYASELRRTKILLNMPPLCRHSVTKIFEGAACGALVVSEQVEDNRNNLPICQYYATASGCADMLRQWKEESKEREKWSQKFCSEVHKNHSLEKRLQVILN